MAEFEELRLTVTLIDNASTGLATLRQNLRALGGGENRERLSFADRQTVAQCLIKKVVVTGEQVDIAYILPFDHAPQVYDKEELHPEGTPGNFYRLRLAHLNLPA